VWNAAAYEVLGSCDELDGAGDEVARLEASLGAPLPAAVREWFVHGGAQRLASISSNVVTRTGDFAGRTVERRLRHGHLLLETDSQRCCRWVVDVSSAYADPPVYLIDADDEAGTTRSRYAAGFSD